jgi:hypothetical protein
MGNCNYFDVVLAAAAVVVTFVTGAAVVAIAVGVAVGVATGAWLVHPAKHAARNSVTKIVEINPTCESLINIPALRWTETLFNLSFCCWKKEGRQLVIK